MFFSQLRNALYLIVEEDGIIQGCAYAGPFHARAAYRYSCELTIYVAQSLHKRSFGRKLYEALEQRIQSLGYLNMYACIAFPEIKTSFSTETAPIFTRILALQK